MKKLIYEYPQAKIFAVSAEDVIATSLGFNDDVDNTVIKNEYQFDEWFKRN